MKRFLTILLSALVFGCVAGSAMVGVNIAAARSGLIQTQAETEEASPEETTTAAAAETKPVADETRSAAASSPVSDVARQAMPSVVAITNMMRYQQYGYSIFGDFSQQETEVPASGSGVIVGQNDTELLIITNNHVVTDSDSLSVTFSDSQSVSAQVKGTDAAADLAIVAVKLSDIQDSTKAAIQQISIGDSDAVEVGDQVVAIGNALGYGQSVTTGIISAKDRDVTTEEGTEEGLLQTDAAINPGNSGGALLNMNGELIGINVAKYSSTEVEGMGYSIPSAKVKDAISSLSSLKTRDEVPENERGYLGVQVKTIDAQTAASFNMPQGVFIYKFTEGSTADNSQLQEKDIITKFDGQGVTSSEDLKNLLEKYRAGEQVSVTVERQNGSGQYEEKTVAVTLGSRESSDHVDETKPSAGNLPGNGNDGSGSSGNGNSGSSRNGDFWKQFEDYFNQYRR